MAEENGGDPWIPEYAFEVMAAITEGYRELREHHRTFSPYVVRTIELLLAIGLLAGLAYWIYLFWTA